MVTPNVAAVWGVGHDDGNASSAAAALLGLGVSAETASFEADTDELTGAAITARGGGGGRGVIITAVLLTMAVQQRCEYLPSCSSLPVSTHSLLS